MEGTEEKRSSEKGRFLQGGGPRRGVARTGRDGEEGKPAVQS